MTCRTPPIDRASVPTDADGHAAVRARLGRRQGLQGIEALVPVPGEDLRVRFRLTALRRMTGTMAGPRRRLHPMMEMVAVVAVAAAAVVAAAVAAVAAVTAAGVDEGGGGHGGGHGNGNGHGHDDD